MEEANSSASLFLSSRSCAAKSTDVCLDIRDSGESEPPGFDVVKTFIFRRRQGGEIGWSVGPGSPRTNALAYFESPSTTNKRRFYGTETGRSVSVAVALFRREWRRELAAGISDRGRRRRRPRGGRHRRVRRGVEGRGEGGKVGQGRVGNGDGS